MHTVLVAHNGTHWSRMLWSGSNSAVVDGFFDRADKSGLEITMLRDSDEIKQFLDTHRPWNERPEVQVQQFQNKQQVAKQRPTAPSNRAA